MAIVKHYWIMERHNPQLGVYYSAQGQMSKTAARKYERPGYGHNIMHEYETEAEYKQALEDLKAKGCSVH